ncbi:hypothetical protein GGR43_004574 [Sphingobium jiangsuense]|uniref:Uncharacterized protein n=1 Tax=Sphingobium jiangsuense TaxID=870476 RepID=A0A7W6FT76_9SPHN|nr:hypothetical protein [Sphingobium jiangsuense]MBB3928829.1 hypothetical protein [Sphingobium jiangsuense]
MSGLRRRLARLEQQKPADAVQTFRADGWVLLARQGKVIFALPDNGRGDCHA